MAFSFPGLQSGATATTRGMRLLGGLAASIFTITIPFFYFGLSVYALHESLRIETAALAKAVEQIIQARPDMWAFEQMRLLEMIAQPSLDGDLDERTIRTAAGTVVVKTDISVSIPAITASAGLFDSGNPVGSIETKRSIRKQIIVTSFLGILCSSIGYLLFFIFRTYPLRRLESTLASLHQAEEEERRNREEAERFAAEMAVIAKIGRLIGSTMDIDEVYERFAAETKKLIPFDRLAVNRHNLHEGIVKVVYTTGAEVPGRRKEDLFPFKGSSCEVLAKTRAGLYGHPKNVEEMNHLPSNPFASAGMRSLLRVPLIYRDEVIGSLHFGLKTTDPYTERDLRLAERIGFQIAGAIGSSQLFSDLNKTENSLRESEARFRGLVEQAAVGVSEIDIYTGRFFTVNRSLCEMMGRTEKEMVATTFLAITHPEDLHLHEEKTRMMLAGEIDHYTLEKRYLRKNGETVWVNITVSPLWKPGEAPGRNIAVVENITDRKRMAEEIISLSITDQLTGLHNRRGFISLAEQQLKLSNRNKRGMQLYFADLDGLKWINDTLGHEEGDRALIETATVFKETFRTSDIIARLGGDEFAALAVDITDADADAEIFTARLQSLIDARNNRENRRYRLSISVGSSYFDPENPCSLNELMARADQLMYEQKQNKRGMLPQATSLSNGIH